LRLHKTFFKIDLQPKNDIIERKAFEESEEYWKYGEDSEKVLGAKDGVLQA